MNRAEELINAIMSLENDILRLRKARAEKRKELEDIQDSCNHAFLCQNVNGYKCKTCGAPYVGGTLLLMKDQVGE